MLLKSLSDQEYINKIQEISSDSDLFKVIQKMIFKKSCNIPIKLDFSNKTINIENNNLNLLGQEKIYKLFSFFYSSPDQTLNRKDLLEKIYLFDEKREVSLRQKNSLNHNIVKLISRARKLASTKFKDINNMSIEWFPYDKNEKQWCLYRLKHTMLKS